MFSNLGVHIIEHKTNCWGYVGTIPAVLGEAVPATREDIMAGRAQVNPYNGVPMTLKFPLFLTAEDAVKFAAERGITAKVSR